MALQEWHSIRKTTCTHTHMPTCIVGKMHASAHIYTRALTIPNQSLEAVLSAVQSPSFSHSRNIDNAEDKPAASIFVLHSSLPRLERLFLTNATTLKAKPTQGCRRSWSGADLSSDNDKEHLGNDIPPILASSHCSHDGADTLAACALRMSH